MSDLTTEAVELAIVTESMDRGAWISPNGLYRYKLWRRWGEGPVMAFAMLNPSTADAQFDDPTIRRCIRFARREGCGSIEVVNLYALRATDPLQLREVDDPEGPENRMAWAEVLYSEGTRCVAAWGAFNLRGVPESLALRGASPKWSCLGTTKSGAPRHPLFVRADQELMPWRKEQ